MRFAPLLIATICLSSVGCQQQSDAPPGISYAEAITIYNQELELLERLKKEKAALEEQLNPIPGTDLAESVLAQATALQGEYNEAIEALLPNQTPKDEANPSAADPLAKVRQRVEQIRQDRLEQAQPIQQKLTELEKEIATQTERVEQAKQVLDTARQQIGEASP